MTGMEIEQLSLVPEPNSVSTKQRKIVCQGNLSVLFIQLM